MCGESFSKNHEDLKYMDDLPQNDTRIKDEDANIPLTKILEELLRTIRAQQRELLCLNE